MPTLLPKDQAPIEKVSLKPDQTKYITITFKKNVYLLPH